MTWWICEVGSWCGRKTEQVGDPPQNTTGTITLSNAAIWSALRSGTILTVIETANAGGEGNFDTGTDLSYDPLAGDWWINVATREEQGKGAAGVTSTTTNDGLPGDFSVGRDDWTVTIWNAADQIVFGPAGEGIPNWPGDGVSNEDGGSLEGPRATDTQPLTFEVWQAITPTYLDYDDTGSTSFGAPNVDYVATTGEFPPIQDLTALRSRFGDFDHDGALTAADIDALSTAVQTGSTDRLYDLNLDGSITDADRVAWVNELKNTWIGDANLDQQFNSSDMVAVFAKGKYETEQTASWSEGDWNGDLKFGSSDMVAAFAAGGYEQGQKAAAAVSLVPEPTSLGLALWGLGLLALGRRAEHWLRR